MPWWLGDGLWLATRFTVGAVGAVAVAGGWLLGYGHRDLIELGRKYGRLLAWRQQRACRELWRDTLRLSAWGVEAVARVNARAVGR